MGLQSSGYDPVVSETSVATMNRFAQAIGMLAGPVAYDQVAALRFSSLWQRAA